MNYIKFSIITILSLYSANSMAEGQGGGLPQMDIGTYPSQIFWLIVTFGILYLFMWKFAIPKLRTTVEERKDKISTDIDDADELKIEAESILSEYKAKITESNTEATEIYNSTKSTIDKKTDLSKQENEQKLKKLIDESQATLKKKENDAIEDIIIKTVETTQFIVEKFINEKISEEEVRKYLN
jgi:F-type H+-transporting ATPase subunit b